MAVTFGANVLSGLRGEYGLNADSARKLIEEAMEDGKITTSSGKPVSNDFPDQYYQLRLAATGSTSHQFKGVHFGDSDEDDRKLRSAMWTLYQEMEKPESARPSNGNGEDRATRRANTDSMNRRSNASRGSQSMTVSFQMPSSHNRIEALVAAEAAIDKWLEEWELKKGQAAKDEAQRAVDKLKNILGDNAEALATTLGVSVEVAEAILNIGKVEPATEENGEDTGGAEDGGEQEATAESEEDTDQDEDEDDENGDEAEEDEEEEAPARGRRNR